VNTQHALRGRHAARSLALANPYSRNDRLVHRLAVIALTLSIILVALTATIAPASAQSARPATFADLVDQVGDSVVNITTSAVVAGRTSPQPMVPKGSPLEDFFNDFMERRDPDRAPRRGQASGSGFVISEDGYIVTNNHVIEGADEILVEFRSGEELPAEVIGTDPNTDIALLKVEPSDPLPFVPFGDSDAMRVGDWVMAMGNPRGLGFSVSAGIVSALERELSSPYGDFIQTDAAINKGNSGGPLFNVKGEVIGVNTAILSPDGGWIGIGFAVSSADVTNVVAQLQEFGETRRGWLGVGIQSVTPDIAEGLGLDVSRGALVTEVYARSPAMEAGIEVGDVIITFDGMDVQDTRELVRNVGNAPVAATVRVVVFRDGATRTLRVTLGRRETAEVGSSPIPGQLPEPPASGNVLGMRLVPLTDKTREALGAQSVSTGLVIQEIDPASDAASRGLMANDIITEVAQQPVSTVEDFQTRITEGRTAGRNSILLLIRRAGNPRFVALSLEEQ